MEEPPGERNASDGDAVPLVYGPRHMPRLLDSEILPVHYAPVAIAGLYFVRLNHPLDCLCFGAGDSDEQSDTDVGVCGGELHRHVSGGG